MINARIGQKDCDTCIFFFFEWVDFFWVWIEMIYIYFFHFNFSAYKIISEVRESLTDFRYDFIRAEAEIN